MTRTNTILLLMFVFIAVLGILLWKANAPETVKTEPAGTTPIADASDSVPFQERVIARIDDEPVMASEVEERIDGFTGKFREINPEMKFPEERLAKMRKDFLDRIIKDKILEQAASKADIQITDIDIDTRIEQFQKIFGEGPEAKKRFLDGIPDMQKFRNQVAKQIRIDRYLDKQMEAKVDVTDAEIEEYYKNNPDLFKADQEIRARHILWKLPKKDDPTYEQKQKEVVTLAEDVLQKLKDGADFIQMAEKYSQDEATAHQGGDLGWFGRERMVKPFSDVAFNLSPDEVSELVTTDFGIHIIQLLEKREPHMMSFDETKDKIRRSLEGKKKQSLREQIYDDLRKNTRIEVLL